MRMNCKDFLARHSEWYDGMLEPSAAELLRAHADACPSCARYDRVVRRGADLARDLLAAIEPSSDFEQRMRHRLFHERDAMAAPRDAGAGVYAVAASIILLIAAAGSFALASSRTPIVDGNVVFAMAPPAISPLQTNSMVVSAAPLIPPFTEKTDDIVAPIEAEAKGHDPHVASTAPSGWPVYSRGAVAAAFPAGNTTLVVRPAEFRPVGSRAVVVPLLVRH